MIEDFVIVSNGKKTYYGKAVWEDDIDTPPVIIAADKTMYWEVWEAMGWTVEYDR